jgi:hypothetical protein
MASDDKPSYFGYATNFGGLYDQIQYAKALAAGKTQRQALAKGDPGIGAPRLGAVNTADSYGVAVPTEYLRKHLGDDPAAWRTARAELKIGNSTVMAPFVDIGPGKKQRDAGVVVDVTTPLSDAMGGFDKTKASVRIVPNAGPDYTTDQDEWHKEQAALRKQVASRPPVGNEPSRMPWTSLLKDSGWMSLMSGDDQKRDTLSVEALTSLV